MRKKMCISGLFAQATLMTILAKQLCIDTQRENLYTHSHVKLILSYYSLTL
jgi:hypothetical protein